MIGAAVFTVFGERLSSFIPWWRLLLGSFFILIVLFLPKGLISLPTVLSDLFGSPPEEVAVVDDGTQEVDSDD